MPSLMFNVSQFVGEALSTQYDHKCCTIGSMLDSLSDVLLNLFLVKLFKLWRTNVIQLTAANYDRIKY